MNKNASGRKMSEIEFRSLASEAERLILRAQQLILNARAEHMKSEFTLNKAA